MQPACDKRSRAHYSSVGWRYCKGKIKQTLFYFFLLKTKPYKLKEMKRDYFAFLKGSDLLLLPLNFSYQFYPLCFSAEIWYGSPSISLTEWKISLIQASFSSMVDPQVVAEFLSKLYASLKSRSAFQIFVFQADANCKNISIYFAIETWMYYSLSLTHTVQLTALILYPH